MTGTRRRRFITGGVGAVAVLSGCFDIIDDSGDSYTHGGVTVNLVHHTVTTEETEVVNDEYCIKSVPDGKVRIWAVVDIDTGDTDIEAGNIPGGTALQCEGDSYELTAIRSITSDDATGERFALGFYTPENTDPASCELELTWAGSAESPESFQFGLGPEQPPDIPDSLPSCDTVESEE